MTRKVKSNLPSSILARLLAESRATGADNQRTLAAYAYERFLARLAHSPVRDRFVLKGAMLMRTWSDHPFRSTRDLDFLRRGDGSDDAIRRREPRSGDIIPTCNVRQLPCRVRRERPDFAGVTTPLTGL